MNTFCWSVSYFNDPWLRQWDPIAPGTRHIFLCPTHVGCASPGIENHNVPTDDSDYGMPFPGTYIIDADGIVQAKYFEQLPFLCYYCEL